MRRCRFAVCAAVAVLAAVAGILPFAQAASADPSDNISVVSVSSPSSGSGALSVVVSSGTPLTSLTVHLSQGNTDVLDVSDFDLSDASFTADQDTTYQLQTPLTSLDAVPPAQDLPPGTYSVTVDATDGGGSVQGVTPQQPGSQSFPFLIQQAVQLNPATITYASVVTFTGQVTGVWPGTSTALPVDNATVQMSGPFGSLPAGPSGLTTAAGDFSISAPTAEVGQQYTAAAAAGSQGTPATSKSVEVTETAATVTLTARLAKTTIKYGQPDTISGTASYTPVTPPTPAPAVALPLAGATVTLSAPGQPRLTTVTGPTGTFTKALPDQKASIEWTASVGGTPLLDLAVDPLKLTVQLPTEFKKVSLSLSALRSLSVKACLNVTSPGNTKFEIIAPVTLQYARAAKGPWRNLATIEPHENTTGYCTAGTPIWLGSAKVPVSNGYYRLTFGGTTGTWPAVSLQPAFTAAAHRWRNPTRVTSFKVTPHQVKFDGVVTVSGRLWRDTGAWHPYAGHRVQILFKVGGTFFAYFAEPKTNSGGYFTGRFVVERTALFLGQYSGDKTDFGSDSGQVKVTVTGSAARFAGVMPGIRRLGR